MKRRYTSCARRRASRGSGVPGASCSKLANCSLRFFNWFTEGFDTLDLKEATALLDELHA
jgi:hypothetical protein